MSPIMGLLPAARRNRSDRGYAAIVPTPSDEPVRYTEIRALPQKLRTCQRTQLAPQRLGCRDQQIAQLAEAGSFRVHSALASGHQRAQRLAFAAGARLGRPRLREHAPRRSGRVERVGLTARTPLAAQAPDLKHPLITIGEETRETGAERARAFDRERPPFRRMQLGELQ